MYSKEMLESYATFENIMKILKKDPRFSEYCSQTKMPAGTRLRLDRSRNVCYLLERGYVKYNFSGEDGMRNFYIVYPGKFISLPVVEGYIPSAGNLLFLNDSVCWTIDFEFLRKVLFSEDPRNFILISFLNETRYKLYVLATVRNLNAENRILLTLVRLANFGMHVSANRVELPPFLTHSMVAELASSSRSLVTHTFRKLHDQGILDSSKKPWVLENFSALQESLQISDIPPY
ncbi:Crp/Fnr family transcriptional regulator [Listeria booriae]|uniref:Crp/Fnr family transcriptional regulator n=1 Tax=Listeria booriae TaxID=1552123 RepID=UPI001626DAB6|nr:Crp/Fnr family transcriptional regulator [Listeria booriae]MBC2259219.1 Crp/Fnr family transcriptional regulator [Listeria booriae]